MSSENDKLCEIGFISVLYGYASLHYLFSVRRESGCDYNINIRITVVSFSKRSDYDGCLEENTIVIQLIVHFVLHILCITNQRQYALINSKPPTQHRYNNNIIIYEYYIY